MQGGWQPPPKTLGGSPYGPPPGTAPPGHTPPPAVPGAYGTYEFNAIENAIIDKTAARTKLWGIVSIVVGTLQLFSSCGAVSNRAFAANLPLGLVALIVGLTFIGVGNSLRSVVTTRGNDLMHMMLALQKTSTAFTIQIICGILGAILAIFTWILVMIMSTASG